MTDVRTALVAGLRDLADFLDEHPDLPVPWIGEQILGVYGLDAEQLAAYGAVPGGWEKDAFHEVFVLKRKFGPLVLQAVASRDEVCERVVVGTETVEIPDPDAPKVTVEREIVEWVCGPVLAKTTS